MYCAPEMLEEENLAGLFTDLWALGCIIYEMACGRQMFVGKTNAIVFDKIQKYDVDWSQIQDAQLRDLIMQLTNPEPDQRIGLTDMQHVKNHPYFQGCDFD